MMTDLLVRAAMAVWLISIIGVMSSCGRSDVGPDSGATDTGNALQVSVALRAESDDGLAGVDVEVDEAWAGVHAVNLVGCSGGSSAELSGPFAVDLLASGTVGNLDAWFERVCKIVVEFTAVVPAGVTTPVDGLSLLARGQTHVGTPFEIRLLREMTVEVQVEPFSLSEDVTEVLVELSVAKWLGGADIDGGEATAGVVVISEGKNEEQLENLHRHLGRSMRARHGKMRGGGHHQ